MKQSIKRNIKLVQEDSSKKVITISILEKRILAITKGKTIKEHLENLPEEKRFAVSLRLLEEVVKIQETKYLNEQGLDLLGKLMGGGLSAGIETIVESLLLGFFSWLGIEKWWLARQITSIIATDPRRLFKALKGDCKEIAKLLAESTVEAMVMGYQQQNKKVSGVFADFMRNAAGDFLKGLTSDLEDKLASKVCELFSDKEEILKTVSKSIQ